MHSVTRINCNNTVNGILVHHWKMVDFISEQSVEWFPGTSRTQIIEEKRDKGH